MGTADTGIALACDVASALLATSVDGLEPVGGGRNSRVFRVRSRRGDFALKQYPAREQDPRDRLGTEVTTLRIMEGQGFSDVPRVVGAEPARGFAAFTWIDGDRVGAVGDDDIDQACAFLARVHALRLLPALPTGRLASEACLSGAEIERQLAMRVAALAGAAADAPELQAFLTERFAPAHDRLLVLARQRIEAAQLDFAAPLPQDRRSLVPADFGFHNTIRRPSGALAFIDFEYFGWDDPVKLTADVLFHPGMPLGPDQSERFRTHATRIFGNDDAFGARLDAYLPLFALRWALIVLNEFLPHRWKLRQLAGTTQSLDEIKRRQLALAHKLTAQAQAA